MILYLVLMAFAWNPNVRRTGLIRTRRHTIASGLGTIAGGEESVTPPSGDPTEIQYNQVANSFYLAVL